MSFVFVSCKLFSNGGFPDTSRTLYQYGSPAFIRPLPLQKLIIYFPFECILEEQAGQYSTLRIFSSILNSYKREKQLQPSKIFIKNSKNVLEMVTMICYNVSAFIKR